MSRGLSTRSLDSLAYFAEMVGCYSALSPEEREALTAWEIEFLPKGLGTSSWPGWKNYIGDPPWTAVVATPRTRSTRRRIPRALIRAVWDRDGWECRGCGSHRDLTVDHVIPLAVGGTDDSDNLQTLCRSCNSRKGAKVE